MKTYIGATNIISSLGLSTSENFDNITKYYSGIKSLNDTTLLERPFLGATIDWQRVSDESAKRNIKGYTKIEQLLILSISDVLEKSGIELSENSCGLIFSTTKGNVDLLSSNSIPEDAYLFNMARNVASYFGYTREPIVVSNACISGVSAIILASRLIREGAFSNIIVAGADILTKFVVSGFMAFKSVSGNPCKPYDASRDGLSLGEGCGSLLITSNKALSNGVVVEGGSITNDANHISGPSRTGDGLSYAISQAMEETGIQISDISFINAHGTATPFNDEMESKAIKLSGLSSIPVNSLKPYIGHTLGASGVIESIICVEQLLSGIMLATKGFENLGVPEEIIVAGKHAMQPMQRCIKTASGFGGCNGAVILSLESNAKAIACNPSTNYEIVKSCCIENGKLIINGTQTYESSDEFATFIRNTFKALEAPNMKFYKMDDLCKLGYVAAEYLLKDVSYSPSEVAILMANNASSLDTDSKHQQIIEEHGDEGASPATFVYTLPNVVLGEICIRHKIMGENTFFVSNSKPSFLEDYAKAVLNRKEYKAVIYGWCNLLGEDYKVDLKLIERN